MMGIVENFEGNDRRCRERFSEEETGVLWPHCRGFELSHVPPI